MDKNDKLKKKYDVKKAVKIKEILSDKKWQIKEVEYDDKSGKYEINATHEDGRTVFLKRNRQYVDNLIQELLDAKEQE